jgi:glyoxylase-like metal-dependent hydrolase (beta-lactamase superfamily II)
MDFDMFSFNVGAMLCRVFADSTARLTEDRVANIFANDRLQHGDRVLTAFRALPEPPEMSQNILYIDNAGRRILIDSGEGTLVPDQPGKLLERLTMAGIAPQTIDMVILTHFHMDHIGGLLDAAGYPNFPNARLVVPVPEHGYWLDPARLATIATTDPDRAALLQRTFDCYAAAGGVVLLAEDAEIMPGIHYVATFGHTPGQCGVLLESKGERLLHIADSVHTLMQLNLLDASPKFDVLPAQAIATRQAIVKQAISENLRIMAYHFPFPGVGHIVARADQIEWLPDLMPD